MGADRKRENSRKLLGEDLLMVLCINRIDYFAVLNFFYFRYRRCSRQSRFLFHSHPHALSFSPCPLFSIPHPPTAEPKRAILHFLSVSSLDSGAFEKRDKLVPNGCSAFNCPLIRARERDHRRRLKILGNQGSESRLLKSLKKGELGSYIRVKGILLWNLRQ